MQPGPDASQLLIAIQRFLQRDLAPAIEDRALKFRTLIAGHLVAQVGSEIQSRDDLTAAQRDGLLYLLGDDADDYLGGPREVANLERELARRIRMGRLGDSALYDTRQHLLETLAGAISMNNPKFDLQLEIE